MRIATVLIKKKTTFPTEFGANTLQQLSRLAQVQSAPFEVEES